MTSEGELSPEVESRPAPLQVGQHVTFRGQAATVLEVAEYPAGICDVVIQLASAPGRPPLSVRLEQLDPPTGSAG